MKFKAAKFGTKEMILEGNKLLWKRQNCFAMPTPFDNGYQLKREYFESEVWEADIKTLATEYFYGVKHYFTLPDSHYNIKEFDKLVWFDVILEYTIKPEAVNIVKDLIAGEP